MTPNINNEMRRISRFLGLLVVILSVLHFVEPFKIGGYEVKSINILADILPEEKEELAVRHSAEVAAQVEQVKEEQSEGAPEGLTIIEDYAPADTAVGMRLFYETLSRRTTLGRPVRIAYFGDSFIEGDIITDHLRELLQEHYGGEGVGFVDIASPFTDLRPMVWVESNGWTDHCVLDKGNYAGSELGISSRYAKAEDAASISLRGHGDYKSSRRFSTATLYMKSDLPVNISISADGSSATGHTTEGTGRVEAIRHKGNMNRVSFTTEGGGTYFGVALEGDKGVVLDNFALRGSSGIPLTAIPERHLSQLGAVRPYDLIVLQFGLNVASKKEKNYSWYKTSMSRVVKHFRAAFPQAAILIVGIGDREDKVKGELRTMPGVMEVLAAQQEVAVKEEIAFWNLFEAMGGEGSIARMATAKPAEANKDYTHINRRGGRRIAQHLFDALCFGHEQYELRK